MIIEIMPVAGMNRMYTSGWPQNQNRCWYSSALPPWRGHEELRAEQAVELEQRRRRA